MKFVICDVPPAGSWKRDCELLDFKLRPLSFQFLRDSDGSKWEVTFQSYIAFKVTSEEFTNHLLFLPEEGSIYTIEDSDWLKYLKKIDTPILIGCKHFILCFYDEIIEVIAKEMAYVRLSE